jgi:hypothetical protein
MTERERLQYTYELAFFPPRLNELWTKLKGGNAEHLEEIGLLLDQARRLHLALPETGYASQRALTRLAIYQAKARAFGMVGFLDNLRQHLDRPPLRETVVPGHLVRDIGLPPLTRPRIPRASAAKRQQE